MFKAKKGQSGIVSGIVGITVAAILVSKVYLPQVFGANTTGWDSATSTIWSNTGLAGGIGMMVLTFRVFGVL
jgi:hypothetical protein